MLKCIERLSEIFNSNQFEKAKYLETLKECDEVIFSFLSEKDYKNLQLPDLFRLNSDERLKIAKHKIQLCEKNPNFALKEVITSKMQHLETFVNKYRIGFVQKAELQETGFVKVDIPCLITSRNYTNNPHSARKLFEIQLQFLKDEGFHVEQDNMGYYFVNDENNINLFQKLLTSRNCKHIEIKTLDSRIRSISFLIHINDLEKMNEIVDKIKADKTDTLNDDEKENFKKYINEIKFAKNFSSVSNNDLVCYSLIESYFAELCKIFNYEGKVVEIHKLRFADEVSKNTEIKSIEDVLSKTYENIDIVENIQSIKKKIEDFVVNKMCFYVSEFYFDKYGVLNLKFRYITNPIALMRMDCMSEDELRNTFKVNSGNRYDENLFIIDNVDNKEKLETILSTLISNFYICDMSVNKKHENYIITDFRAFLDEVIGFIS
jgi:hypothetical protein